MDIQKIISDLVAKLTGNKDLIASFDLEPRIIERKNQFIVYIKEAAQIVEELLSERGIAGGTK